MTFGYVVKPCVADEWSADRLAFFSCDRIDRLNQSLGCTLFALAYDFSPFEDPSQGGGSIAMAVGSGRYRHPADSEWSKGFKWVLAMTWQDLPVRHLMIDHFLFRSPLL